MTDVDHRAAPAEASSGSAEVSGSALLIATSSLGPVLLQLAAPQQQALFFAIAALLHTGRV